MKGLELAAAGAEGKPVREESDTQIPLKCSGFRMSDSAAAPTKVPASAERVVMDLLLWQGVGFGVAAVGGCDSSDSCRNLEKLLGKCQR